MAEGQQVNIKGQGALGGPVLCIPTALTASGYPVVLALSGSWGPVACNQ